MDISLIVGLLVSFGALGVGMIMEGAELFGFIGISPAMIVFGGTLGIILVAHPLANVKRIPKLLGIALRGNDEDSNELVTRLVDLAEKARREGLLSLEEEAANMDDPFIKKGLMLVIDGTDPDQVRDILEIEIERMEERHKAGYKIFEDGGGYAPTVGIIGTVLGLVNVLSNLSDPSTIGPAIAVAFLATLYGVGSANLYYLPVGTKLKGKSEEEAMTRTIAVEGILAIQAGENPRIVEERLVGFLEPVVRAARAEASEA